jgi:hypothetical protein
MDLATTSRSIYSFQETPACEPLIYSNSMSSILMRYHASHMVTFTCDHAHLGDSDPIYPPSSRTRKM